MLAWDFVKSGAHDGRLPSVRNTTFAFSGKSYTGRQAAISLLDALPTARGSKLRRISFDKDGAVPYKPPVLLVTSVRILWQAEFSGFLDLFSRACAAYTCFDGVSKDSAVKKFLKTGSALYREEAWDSAWRRFITPTLCKWAAKEPVPPMVAARTWSAYAVAEAASKAPPHIRASRVVHLGSNVVWYSTGSEMAVSNFRSLCRAWLNSLARTAFYRC
jgi:hypothetical protein